VVYRRLRCHLPRYHAIHRLVTATTHHYLYATWLLPTFAVDGWLDVRFCCNATPAGLNGAGTLGLRANAFIAALFLLLPATRCGATGAAMPAPGVPHTTALLFLRAFQVYISGLPVFPNLRLPLPLPTPRPFRYLLGPLQPYACLCLLNGYHQ
jgi:hypothetical protein